MNQLLAELDAMLAVTVTRAAPTASETLTMEALNEMHDRFLEVQRRNPLGATTMLKVRPEDLEAVKTALPAVQERVGFPQTFFGFELREDTARNLAPRTAAALDARGEFLGLVSLADIFCATMGCPSARSNPDEFCASCRADIEDFAVSGKTNR